jgi:hypothetical protein
VRQEAVNFCRWAGACGLVRAEVARRLGVGERTLRHWEAADRAGQLQARPRGRPVGRSGRDDRQQVVDFLDVVGPGVGLPTLQAVFQPLPRAELADLLGRYRRVWVRRYRRQTEVLHWQRVGAVWALDFAAPPAPVDGLYPFVLAVRDLASGQQLLWQPVGDATAATACAALTRLLVQHGAPLVLKLDNGSAIRAVETQRLLGVWKVTSLYSPVCRPAYNGAIEAGIGSLKSRTDEQAARQGRAGAWSWDDLEAARLRGNELSRPRGAHGPTPDQLWSARPVLADEEREGFLATLARQQEELGLAPGAAQEDELTEREEARRRREAIRRTLVAHGILCVTRRSIPLPITLRKVAKIT